MPTGPRLRSPIVERRRLTAIWTNATEAFFESELALGRHVDAVPELERLAAGEPLNEDWWSLLAVALYRSGRQADALSALRQARSHLADELGLDPGPRLRGIEQAVLVQDDSLDVPDIRGSNGLGGSSAPRVPVMRVEGCPYKGLAVYEVENSERFRGRNRLVAEADRDAGGPLPCWSSRAPAAPGSPPSFVPGSFRRSRPAPCPAPGLEAGGGQCGRESRRFAGRCVR